ncbi:MAG: type II secretion system protein GspN [Desulfobacterota bacterium]|jgi:type II secretion system protein N|nr:type II secretion system protein GspN [Thermodesulfobacteriota bacterium]
MADVRARSGLWIKAGLGLYAFVCIVLFIWMRFPYDSLKYRIEDALTGVLGAPVALGHIEPSLLWGFRVDSIEIRGNQVAKKLSISPRPWEMFRSSLGFGFHADLVSGTTEGLMRLPFRKSKRPMEITLDLANVDLNGLSKVFPANMKPRGTVSGELNLKTPRDSLEKAIGSLALTWKKGSLPLGMVTLPFDALTFENLELDGTIDKGLLNFEKVEFTGDFAGTMTGSIRLSRDIKRSRLNITGEMTLPETMRNALGADSASSGQGTRFSLRGSIEKPRFRMLGMHGGVRAGRTTPSQDSSLQVPSPVARGVPGRARQEAVPQPQVEAPFEQGSDAEFDPDGLDTQQPTEPEGE